MAELVSYDGGGKPDTREQRERREEWQKIQDAAQPVLLELVDLIKEQIQLREPVEQRWLEDLRQFHGHYDRAVELELKNDNERSRTFINITRPKTNAWAARLADMLFPNDEKNWGIDPTPLPDLTREARTAAQDAEKAEKEAESAAEQHNEAIEAGQPPDPATLQQAEQSAQAGIAAREAEKAIQRDIEEARKRCSNMERLIDDQLTESKFPARSRDAIIDGCKLGPGIMKGPIVAGGKSQKWEIDGDGNATLIAKDATNPAYRRVNPWHFFPDMNAECIEDAAFTFERYLPNAKMLRRMAREMGFMPETVRQLLAAKPGATTDDTASFSYLTELRGLENHGGQADSALGPFKDRFVVWEFRGSLEIEQIVKMIRAAGRFQDADRFEEKADPLTEHMVTVFFCQGRLLKISEDYILDSGASLYSVWSFEKAEASILGAVGVPRLMKHEQHMLNSAVRMVMDNAALSVAPQVIIDQNNIEPVNGDWKITPRKVWRWIKNAANMGQTGQMKPFDAIPIPLNQAQLAAIVEMALKFVDEAIAMPIIAQGEQGSHVTQTAQGMTMLMNSANVVFRLAVKNYDDDMIGLITRAYDFNMQFSDREEVKGDMKVEARGTSVLLVREVQAQQLQMLLREWSTHPIMGVAVRAYNMMRMVLQAMNINPNDVLVAEEDYLDKLAKMAEGGGEESPEAIRAASAREVAEIDARSRTKQGQVNLQIAKIRRESEFAKLATQEGISLKQIQAMFATKAIDGKVKLEAEGIKTRSSERALAAEIAVERENAREARARGEDPTGSGGAVSMGSEAA